MSGQGAGSERAGPFPFVEPLGLLWGAEAQAAVEMGAARWMGDGRAAFTMARWRGQVLPVANAAVAWPGKFDRLPQAVPDWAGLGPGPLLMGIVNVTPDSFSDGGERLDPAVAVAAGFQMAEDGADIVDVGGESTRPGAHPVTPEAELARVAPVVAALARAGVVVSIDTRNASTMARALDAGARIVNDVSGLRHDAAALPLVAARGCPVVVMHMRGTPQTMNGLAVYADVAIEVADELAALVAAVEGGGVLRANIAVDPGFGFAKNAAQSEALLRRLPLLTAPGYPLLAGVSRKHLIGMLTGEEDPKRRVAGSVAAALFAYSRGARVLRVHDLRETRQALDVWRALT